MAAANASKHPRTPGQWDTPQPVGVWREAEAEDARLLEAAMWPRELAVERTATVTMKHSAVRDRRRMIDGEHHRTTLLAKSTIKPEDA